MTHKTALLKELNEALNPKYREVKIPFEELRQFAAAIGQFLQQQHESDVEGVLRTNLRDLLRDTFYKGFVMRTEAGRYDLTIQETNDAPIKVLFELKRPDAKIEMCTKDDLNKKALQELVYYYMKEREKDNGGNVYLCHLLITNGNEFFLFEAKEFEQKFYKSLKKKYHDFQSKTEAFYEEIAAPAITAVQESDSPLRYTYFRLHDFDEEIQQVLNGQESLTLAALYKLLSPTHLLKKRIHTDPNELDRQFYNELLHILGLEERKEENGGKMLIARKEQPDSASLVEQTYNKVEKNWQDFANTKNYGLEREEQMFNITLELVITWLNRILFLKLLEAQLRDYSNDAQYEFLNTQKIGDFTQLNDLFFDVLAIPVEKRQGDFCERFKNVPYLNSALFERTELEKTIKINSLQSNAIVSLYSQSVLRKGLQEEKNEWSIFEYLFTFLEAYNFGSPANDTSTKNLINASVLGLIFEKINGHKDGAIFTPSYITSFICRETIRRTVLDKFNAKYNWTCRSVDELQNDLRRNKIGDDEAIEVINSLRICDPAVGSGHFLVSALNELVFLKYDLNLLKEHRKGRLFEYTLKIENDELVVYDRNGDLFHYNKNDEKSQRAQETLFNEKRYLIEHCLFGVDINPTSVQICRLRLWIELLKHAYYTRESHYNNLETLPNIDINIKCGNSLVYVCEMTSSITTLLREQELLTAEQLRQKVAQYQNAKEKEEKYELERLIASTTLQLKGALKANHEKSRELDNCKLELQTLLAQNPIFERDNKEQKAFERKKGKLQARIAELEDYFEGLENQNAFEWRLAFPEVWDAEGKFVGFDAVIGNPPYIQLQKMGARAELLKQQGYETYDSMGDIYSLFYELGYKLLRPNGKLCYITSNKWMRAGYGEKTREFFVKRTNPELLIDFAGVKIFENATVDTNILLFSKSVYQHTTICAVARQQEKESLKDLSLFVEQENSICDFSNSDSWVILSPIEQSIKRKIEAVGTPLRDWDIQINYGIKTGCNEAFIIDTAKRDEILANCQTEDERRRTEEIIRPILRGRDIKRYGYEWAGLYLIATFPSRHYNIDDYPAVRNYLLSFGIERLEQTGETRLINGNSIKSRKRTNNKWFEMQDSISYWEDFSKPKIVYMEIQTDNPAEGYPFPCYSYDDNRCVVLNTGYIMSSKTTDSRYVLGILNSRLGKFLVKLYVTQLQERQFRMLSQYVMRFPIVQPSKEQEAEMIQLVQDVLEHQSAILEKRIDELAFQIYGLSEPEIKVLMTSS